MGMVTGERMDFVILDSTALGPGHENRSGLKAFKIFGKYLNKKKLCYINVDC